MITNEQIQTIAGAVKASQVDESALAQLRGEFPDIHFTWCMDDDVADSAKPVMEAEGFNIYLVDGREHCLCMTNDAEIATGLVVAEVIEEDA
ncbi:MAG: DUF6129 family protein [Gammaproteobacteria bacterium]